MAEAPDQSQRLDIAVVERGLAATRSRARDLIRRGLVTVDGISVTKPASSVCAEAIVTVSADASDHVSRGAEKLLHALQAFAFDPNGRVALDVGASTGGFTEVLLRAGAMKVYAVDVGHGQLHERLKADPRVVSLEGQDARLLDREIVPEAIGAITADVSFISLAKALPAALDLAGPGAWLVALIKPQFEAGPDGVGKGGIVRDPGLREKVVEDVRSFVASRPLWTVTGVVPSPITGGSGNEEFLLGAVRDR